MSYEKLKRESESLSTTIRRAENIIAHDFLFSIQADKGIGLQFVGSKNLNRAQTAGEEKLEKAVKAAIAEYIEPLKERLEIVNRKLAAADELLSEGSD